MRWGNCWFFAVPKWLKNPRNTYLIVRLSHEFWFPVPHMFFARSIEHTDVEEFKPLPKTKKKFFDGPLGLVFSVLPLNAVIFHGRIRRGVGEETNEHDSGNLGDD